MKKSFKKFSALQNGEYWKKFFDSQKLFYGAIKEHIEVAIPKDDTAGIDIGAGPGIGAKLMDGLSFETKLFGFEPSATHFDGIKLAEELAKNSKVNYIPINLGISGIKTEPESLDYILILRAPHEIALSIGKEKFFLQLSRIIKGLKKGGVLIVADPQYTGEATREVVELVQKFQINQIGHTHNPTDYILAPTMRGELEKLNMELVRETIIPNQKLLEYLNRNGLCLEESPCSFYVQTYKLA